MPNHRVKLDPNIKEKTIKKSHEAQIPAIRSSIIPKKRLKLIISVVKMENAGDL